jgi:hypothetical protein
MCARTGSNACSCCGAGGSRRLRRSARESPLAPEVQCGSRGLEALEVGHSPASLSSSSPVSSSSSSTADLCRRMLTYADVRSQEPPLHVFVSCRKRVILLYAWRPHTNIYVSSHCYMCVHTLLQVVVERHVFVSCRKRIILLYD